MTSDYVKAAEYFSQPCDEQEQESTRSFTDIESEYVWKFKRLCSLVRAIKQYNCTGYAARREWLSETQKLILELFSSPNDNCSN